MNGWLDRTSYQLELLHSIYNSPATIAVIDSQGLLMDMNRDPSDTFGYSKQEMIGERFLRWLDESSHDAARRAFRRTMEGERLTQSIRIVTQAGQTVEMSANTSPLKRGGDTVGVVVMMHDISDHKRSLERIRYMAYYDDMTGLPGRRFFASRLEDRLAAARAGGSRLALCYLDVDRFKLVNTSFGRDSGDVLLLQIAERLTHFFRDQGSVARMEGDEFAGIIEEIGEQEEVIARLDELMRLFEAPFELSGVPLHISVSVGVALGDGLQDDGAALLKKADAALYRAKANGRNDFCLYDTGSEERALHTLTLQHDLMRGLQNNEFLLHYQPQYELDTGRIVGLEALVRWKHPERGLVSPGEFIPAAEDSGIIVPLGDWVLREACRQNKAWQDEGMPAIPISVNLSVRQFNQRNLIGKIEGFLRETGLEPRYLKLEITESMTMDVERSLAFLQELRDLGVGISIDDFGTGYSSFHYLRNFPIGSLKIDRSFVKDIGADPNNAAIVAAIIAMAHHMKMQVIAEGVETLEQVRFLQRHRCDEMQGYYGSPPLSGVGIASLMENGEPLAALQ